MAMRCRWVVTLLVALALVGMPASAGAAEDRDPAISDPCGVLDGGLNAMGPWVDVCSADLVLLSPPGAVPVLEVTLTVAEDLEPRTPSYFAVSWWADGCYHEVRLSDASRVDVVGQVGVGRSTAQASAGCGELTEEPCWYLPALTCQRWPASTVTLDLSDEVEVTGRTITWTLPFDDDLADFAGSHRHGAELTDLRAETWADLWIGIAGGRIGCLPDDDTCVHVGGDRARSDHHRLGGA